MNELIGFLCSIQRKKSSQNKNSRLKMSKTTTKINIVHKTRDKIDSSGVCLPFAEKRLPLL